MTEGGWRLAASENARLRRGVSRRRNRAIGLGGGSLRGWLKPGGDQGSRATTWTLGRRRAQRPKNLPKKPRRDDEPELPDANMVDGATVRVPSYSWTERNRGGAEANRPRPPPLARSRARTLASVT